MPGVLLELHKNVSFAVIFAFLPQTNELFQIILLLIHHIMLDAVPSMLFDHHPRILLTHQLMLLS